MLNYKRTYNNNLISSWFITLLLFLGIGGYTNYTPPIVAQTTIELVIYNKKSYDKTFSYSEALLIKEHFDTYNTYLKQISKYHTTISLIKIKEFNNSIPLSIMHKVFFIRNNNYTVEEDSFHLV
ncbi:hypothetical protein [uncultured Aquimarina sp.]|uniref:hypothetical protein n=1 Tax=uncultured Aquimarina sp. TaxID=575652 RepID=UPI002610A08D|nr:hypothetical protein [uncultured Aquimarina sp.]